MAEMFGKQTELEMGSRVRVHAKPLWVYNSEHKARIQWYAKIRSQWFTLYSFGGGVWYGGDRVDGTRSTFQSQEPVYCDKEACANQIVILSKWMLQSMEQMGRVPIAGDCTNLLTGAVRPPMDDEWVNSMKQRYSLYLTLEELYTATENMTGTREINEKTISVAELTAREA